MFSSSTGKICSFVCMNSLRANSVPLFVSFSRSFIPKNFIIISSATVTFKFNMAAVQLFKFTLEAFTGGVGCFLHQIYITNNGSEVFYFCLQIL